MKEIRMLICGKKFIVAIRFELCSPFLFLIAAEALQVLIIEACGKGFFKGISLNNEETNLSLLQYANDALDLGLTYLKVVYTYGIGVYLDEVKSIALSLNCKGDSLPFNYLGLPVGKDMSKASSWAGVVDRFTNRLSSWKANFLSCGGRLTLTKSVFGSLPVYYLSLFRAPKKIINLLERIRCRFFWGFKEDEKRLIWIKWKTALASIDQGGLEIGSIYAKNMSLLGNWWWRFLYKGEALWCRVIKLIYGNEGGLMGELGTGLKYGFWENIVSVGAVIDDMGIPFRNSFIRKIGCGNSIHSGPIGRSLSDLHSLLALPEGTFLRPGIEDSWSWVLDHDGLFSVKRLSKLIDSAFLSDRFPGKTHEWNPLIPKKINIFLWRLVLGRIPLLTKLDWRGVDVP
ncbi:hypothetical protein Tco_0409560 [Tanacetum coccineum]